MWQVCSSEGAGRHVIGVFVLHMPSAAFLMVGQ